MRKLIVLASTCILGALTCAPAVPSSAFVRQQARFEQAPEKIGLSIFNSNDYISTDPSVVEQFHDYVLEKDNVDLQITYDCFDTNETMLSTLETGAKHYDLITPSDYMIQRMIGKGLLHPFDDRAATYAHNDSSADWPDNYSLYASPYLQNMVENVHTSYIDKDKIEHTVSLKDYTKGYMWGTLGLLYNPAFAAFASAGNDAAAMKAKMNDWNTLWEPQFKNTFQIKDSMRDTFSIGLMHAFDQKFTFGDKTYSGFADLRARHNDGTLTDGQYNSAISVLFNGVIHADEFNTTADQILDRAQNSLSALKDNSYGLEVDSGKQDIIAGKSGIDTAWSGDAVWSIKQAENEIGMKLYYSVPKTGGNIWFDGWVMEDYEGLNEEYAMKFIDFVSRPDIAAENMSAVGYTSFIGGDEVLSLIREWYDSRAKAMYVWVDDSADDWENSDFLRDEDGNPVLKDGTGSKSVSLYYGDAGFKIYDQATDGDSPTGDFTLDFGAADFAGSTYAAPILNGTASTWDGYSSANGLGWSKNDLSYFFNGSLTGYADGVDTVFYTDEFETLADTDGTDFIAGRGFYAQYPIASSLPSLAVMADYGAENSDVLRVWEAVKSDSLELWVIITFVAELLVLAVALTFFFVRKRASKLLRLKRREDLKKHD